jgi:hypothetical protein
VLYTFHSRLGTARLALYIAHILQFSLANFSLMISLIGTLDLWISFYVSTAITTRLFYPIHVAWISQIDQQDHSRSPIEFLINPEKVSFLIRLSTISYDSFWHHSRRIGLVFDQLLHHTRHQCHLIIIIFHFDTLELVSYSHQSPSSNPEFYPISSSIYRPQNRHSNQTIPSIMQHFTTIFHHQQQTLP